MVKVIDDNYSVIELDPDLLLTSFKVQTNWHVITGAPCSGKTTLIDLFAARGYQIVPEVGRRTIEMKIGGGQTIEEIRANKTTFARLVKELQLGTERGLNTNEVILLDRALPDCLAYYRLVGLNPNDILTECFFYRYASVSILDRLPIQQDGVRTEDGTTARFLDEWLDRDYRALGYNVVRVPILTPKERLNFVIETLAGIGAEL